MTRRTFMGAGAGGALAAAAGTPPVYTLERFFCRDAAELRRLYETRSGGASLCLEAVAAAHQPQLAVLRGAVCPGSPIFELRTYAGASAPRLRALFERAGIRPVLAVSNGTFLIPFASLEARERAWSAAAADPDWIRACSSISLTEIAVFRVMPAARPGSAWPPVCLRTP